MSLVCNFPDGGVCCPLPRHRTSGGKLRTKCAAHFAAENKKWKVSTMKKLEQKTIDTSVSRSNFESTGSSASNDYHNLPNDTLCELTHESSSYEICLVCGEMM
jgi:hypothetical protein